MSRHNHNPQFPMGITKDVPKRLSRFESLAKNLGLSEDQWHSSIELQAFAKEYRDMYFVPEALLRTWGITTIWDSEGCKPSTLVSDEPIDKLVDTENEPAFTPDYL